MMMMAFKSAAVAATFALASTAASSSASAETILAFTNTNTNTNPRSRSSIFSRPNVKHPSQYNHPHQSKWSEQSSRNPSLTKTNLYRKFHDYGWSKLVPNDDDDAKNIDTVPEELKSNASPVKGAPPGTNVVAKMRSISQFPSLVKGENSAGAGDQGQVLRLARSAFLETQSPTSEALITPMTIHVLNFVLFPSPHIRDAESSDEQQQYLGLPIFGADIVSLPGNKHLVALDFQPVLALGGDGDGEDNNDGGGGKGKASLFPEQYSHLESKLKAIHSKYQESKGDASPLLPWGGDIPPQAKRFFSPYALWTRLADDNAMDTVDTVVWDAYQEYTDLYLELMNAVQDDVNDGKLEIIISDDAVLDDDDDVSNPVFDGQIDYLEYRRTNDPARPMLRRLYGDEWAESVIGDVLFPNL